MDHHHGYSNLRPHCCIVCFQRGRCGDCLPIPSLARDHGLWYRVIRPMHWSCISVDLMILWLTLNPASRSLSELYGRMVSILTSVFLFNIQAMANPS